MISEQILQGKISDELKITQPKIGSDKLTIPKRKNISEETTNCPTENIGYKSIITMTKYQ